jgi:hypothetical protein
MMRTAWCLPVLLVLAGLGCLQLPHARDKKPAAEAAPPAVKPRRPAPVLPDQVNEDNARAKADALDEEIARDEEGDTPAPAGPDRHGHK